MKRMYQKKVSSFVMAVIVFAAMLVGSGTAQAELQALGPVSPATGYPFWYEDTNGLALSLCLDQNGFCLLPAAFNFPANRADINPANFPDEAFYYMADTSGTSPEGTISLTLYEAAVESGFVTGVLDGGQAVFTRIRVRANVTVPGTYTLTHPYGTKSFDVTTIGPGPEINDTVDIPGLVLAPFDQNHPSLHGLPPILPQDVGPFLRRADGITITDPLNPNNRYIGLPGQLVAVTGSPTGNNFVRITGPGTDILQLDSFGLMGKIVGLDVTPQGLSNFGNWKPNSPSTPITFTVTNRTGVDIPARDLVVVPAVGLILTPSIPEFSIPALTDTCAAGITAVAPGNTCTFDVVFTPTANGVSNGSISLANAASPTVSILVTGTGDSIAPVAAITGITRMTPTTGQAISGTVSDNFGVAAVQVSVNGTIQGSAVVTNGAWSFNVAGLNPDAINSIAVIATDTAQPAPGNQTTENDTITVDTIAPAVAIDALPVTITIASQAITGTTTDLNTVSSVSVNVNGALQGLATVTGGTWSFNVSNLTPNAVSSITAIAADPAGNQATSAAASITFTAPVDGDFNIDGQVNISDALLTLRAVVGLGTPSAEQKAHADCAPLGAPNRTLDVADALLILRKIVGLVTF